MPFVEGMKLGPAKAPPLCVLFVSLLFCTLEKACDDTFWRLVPARELGKVVPKSCGYEFAAALEKFEAIGPTLTLI